MLKILDESVRIYCGDCRDILLALEEKPAAIISDPPYGISVNTQRKASGRGDLADVKDFPAIEGDQSPFDPTHLLGFSVVVLFGGNYFCDKLPISGGWVVWDKLNGLTGKRKWGFNDSSDCELIWTNVGNVARLIPLTWMGCVRESEQRELRVHPTQKPVRLMHALINQYTKRGDLVVDPYMGSGTTGIACVMLGRRFIGMEIEPQYFEAAEKRLKKALRRGVGFDLT